MAELLRISDLINELRSALNAYGDSDERVLYLARDRIFSRANEVFELHEQIRNLRMAARTASGQGEGE